MRLSDAETLELKPQILASMGPEVGCLFYGRDGRVDTTLVEYRKIARVALMVECRGCSGGNATQHRVCCTRTKQSVSVLRQEMEGCAGSDVAASWPSRSVEYLEGFEGPRL